VNTSPLKSLYLLKEMNEDYYGDARSSAAQKGLVGYVNVFAPTELFYAMNIVPIFPENHAVFMQARKRTVSISSTSERVGFPSELCSYALCDLGYMLRGLDPEESPIGGIPKPDFLLTTNAQCGTLTKWFERMSEFYDIPLFLIDVPFTGGKSHDHHSKAYVKAQLHRLVHFLEEISGNKLDFDRLGEVIAISNETTGLWNKIIDSARHIPSPISVFDQFFCMAPIVSQRGTPKALHFYQELSRDIEERVHRKIGAIPDEKYRLYWDSLPLWHELKWLSKLLTSHGASLVSTIYTLPWAHFHLDPNDPLSSWTEEYVHYFDWHLNRRVDLILDLKEKYHLNGFIYHMDRSCKMFSTAIPEIKRAVQKKTGIPGHILEGDHGDPRFYTCDRIELGLSTYFDILGQQTLARAGRAQ
jgi:benzoyl-CoA reductase/2-hydroxyglutaryl-CoA dehydratase subunit BcrC/BadD/HgdB